ncbi:DsbA family protein [Nonomuraea endophytica]|uniref:Protein-disulfide isomerase n=1 Tax=Nonomuraea endophytica TaxID=714136 RepID=A0A7W8EGW6_9ACTN|nr:thioredoxin domain-containing protein [Nonomuraea endophytica]MBB5077937.1 protein-disulfide isomerase [Nonomuraea endophytica]
MTDDLPRERSRRRVLAGALAGAAALTVLGVAALRRDPGPTAGPAEPTTPGPAPSPSTSDVPTWVGPTAPGIETGLSLGQPGALVAIEEFGDFKCPSCRRYAREIAPALKTKYLDTGIARVFWRDYPIRGRDSTRAAHAGRAAARQGRFWPFHDVLYSGEVPLSDSGLREAADRAGLDLARFERDRKDPSVRQAVQADLEFALQLGLPGTPAFLINGELLFGAQPVAAFEKAIEKARRAR